MDRRKMFEGSKQSKTLIYIILIVVAVIWYIVSQQRVTPVSTTEDAGDCQIHMIDIGQGDAFLITCDDTNVLIDAGPRSGKPALEAYLSSQKISSFDLVIFTHPHEDHIGGGTMIMENYDVARVMMPDAQTDTAAFEALLESIDASGAEVIIPDDGDIYDIGDLKFTVLSPIGKSYGDLNNYSVVVRVDYKDVSALFTGDAEVQNEKEMIEKYPSLLDCDVLKVGHHGSTSSTCVEFLYKVDPKIALISCAEGSAYGHPHDETIDKLEGKQVTIRRTDLNSDVVIASDGEQVWIYE